jgi:hypothetical protein
VRAHVAHHLQDLFVGFAQADHQPLLVGTPGAGALNFFSRFRLNA